MYGYRLMWRTVPKIIDACYWDIRNGVRNLWHFRRSVWQFRAFDYTGLLGLIETAALDMKACHDQKITTDWEKCSKELAVLAEMCRRLSSDNYFDNNGAERRKRDLEAFRESFKRLPCWWN